MNYPTPVTKDQLADILQEMSALVREGDSFEGFIEYSMPCEEKVPDDTYALVRTRYRVGNLMGQGGMRMLGRMHPPPMVKSDDPHFDTVLDYTAPDEEANPH